AAEQAAALLDAAAPGRERPPRLQALGRPGGEALQPGEDEADLFPRQGRAAPARRVEEGPAPAGEVNRPHRGTWGTFPTCRAQERWKRAPRPRARDLFGAPPCRRNTYRWGRSARSAGWGWRRAAGRTWPRPTSGTPWTGASTSGTG